MKTIAIDAMGGDHAPQAVVEGVNQALATFDDIQIQLYGDEKKIRPYLTARDRVEIIHTTEKINSDDEPTKAIRKKKEASMVLATKAVKEGRADAVLSAGNTGAFLAAGISVVGRINGVKRPGLLTSLPTVSGGQFDMLDLGANTDSTPLHLHQYAVLGSFYAEKVRAISRPRVAFSTTVRKKPRGMPCVRRPLLSCRRIRPSTLLAMWRRVSCSMG